MRISRHQMFMEIARVASKRSTCQRKSVGAVLVEDGKYVVGIGYNGSPPRAAHCGGAKCPLSPSGGCVRAIHAEINCIEHSKMDRPRAIYSMYCTTAPCIDCARKITRHIRIENIYYESSYRVIDGVLELLNNDVNVYRVTPSGYVLQITKEDQGSELHEVPII